MKKLCKEWIIDLIVIGVIIMITNGCYFPKGEVKQNDLKKEQIEIETENGKKKGDPHKLESKFDDIFGFGDL